jgi:hypothetical protein
MPLRVKSHNYLNCCPVTQADEMYSLTITYSSTIKMLNPSCAPMKCSSALSNASLSGRLCEHSSISWLLIKVK